MNRKISPKRAVALIADMLTARLDLRQLAEKHGLDVQDLAEWFASSGTRRRLTALCELADFQTQLVLSQYRSSAASKLLQMAAGGRGDGGDGAEEEDRDLVRKAAVDLLKLSMIRRPAVLEEEPENGGDAFFEELRKEIFGDPASRRDGHDGGPSDAPPAPPQ